MKTHRWLAVSLFCYLLNRADSQLNYANANHHRTERLHLDSRYNYRKRSALTSRRPGRRQSAAGPVAAFLPFPQFIPQFSNNINGNGDGKTINNLHQITPNIGADEFGEEEEDEVIMSGYRSICPKTFNLYNEPDDEEGARSLDDLFKLNTLPPPSSPSPSPQHNDDKLPQQDKCLGRQQFIAPFKVGRQSNGRSLNGTIDCQTIVSNLDSKLPGNSLLGRCLVSVKDKVVGRILYRSMTASDDQPKFLGVTDLRNFSHQLPNGVKNVGKNLLAIAYQISRHCGFGGRVGLVAVDEALGFYRKIGFSHLTDYGCVMFLNWRGRRTLRNQFTSFKPI